MTSLVLRRLRAHHLVGAPFRSAAATVHAFGAVQSQDFPAAMWGIARRLRKSTADDLASRYDRGEILRTHVMRPTWHFVLPADVRWLLALTSTRLRASLAGRRRRLEIDDRLIARANAVFEKALRGGQHLTRPELGEALQAAGISAEGQRLPHLLGHAELEGVVISGARRGKQHTYALFDERVPEAAALDRRAALGELARRFFTSHGPAQIADFTWWSGLTAADAREGIAAAGDALAHERIDGKDYWLDAGARGPGHSATVAHLLPNFDEYTVGYRDRSAMLDPGRRFDASIFSFGSVLANVLLVDGIVRGSWRRVARGDAFRVELRFLGRLTRRESAALDRELDRMARFLGREVALEGRIRRSS
jgi:hypothetical protein